MDKVKIWTDGGSRGNPGIAGAGGIKRVATSLIDLWSQNEVHVDVAIADPLNPFPHGLTD